MGAKKKSDTPASVALDLSTFKLYHAKGLQVAVLIDRDHLYSYNIWSDLTDVDAIVEVDFDSTYLTVVIGNELTFFRENFDGTVVI